jgi:hypothetical protein
MDLLLIPDRYNMYCMKNVYSSPHLFLVHHFKSILESHNIPCIVKNAYLSGAAGELPPTEVWPVLGVEDDRDFQRAQRIVNQELSSFDSNEPAWICPACGESVDGQFNQCWNCETFRRISV